jgi:hypothetical protein
MQIRSGPFDTFTWLSARPQTPSNAPQTFDSGAPCCNGADVGAQRECNGTVIANYLAGATACPF